MFPDLTRDDVFRLETRRLWLRWPQPADIPTLVGLAGERAVAEMTARVPHPYEAADARAFIQEARRSNAAGEGLVMAIAERGRPGRLIGAAGIGPAPEAGVPQLGYWLGLPYWGQGLATEAVCALTRAFFAYAGGVALTAEVLVKNPASRRVLERCGFDHEGQALRALPLRGGAFPVDLFRLDQWTWDSLRQRPGLHAPWLPVRAGQSLSR